MNYGHLCVIVKWVFGVFVKGQRLKGDHEIDEEGVLTSLRKSCFFILALKTKFAHPQMIYVFFIYKELPWLGWLSGCFAFLYCEKKKRILVSQICAHLMCACQFDGLKKIWVFKLRILIHYHWKFQKVKRKNDPPFSTFFWHQTSIGCRSVNIVMKKLWL